MYLYYFQNTHNIFYYKTLGNVTFEMQSERPHLYLLPIWNTRGRHIRNQLTPQMSPLGLTASHPGGTSIHSAFRLGTLAVGDRPCRGLLLSALQLWVFHSKDKTWVVCASPGPQLISTEQHVLLECLPVWQTLLSGPALEAKNPA